MTEVVYLVLGVVIALIVVQVIRIVNQNRLLKEMLAATTSELVKKPQLDANFLSELKKIAVALTYMVRGQQFAPIFEIGKDSLRVNPEDFKPKKEAIREEIHKGIEKALETQAIGAWGPDSCAGITMDRSGIASFLKDEPKRGVRQALERLFANKDRIALHAFADDIVDQLCPEEPEAVPI